MNPDRLESAPENIWEVLQNFFRWLWTEPEGELALLSAAIAAILALAGFIRYGWPALKILYKTCYSDVPFGAILVLGAFFQIWFSIGRVKGNATLYDAVRLRAEAEVFTPRPRRLVFAEQYPDNPEHAEQEYRREKRRWKSTLAGTTMSLLREFGRETPEIVIDTCFDLYKAEERMRRYFGALAGEKRSVMSHEEREFLSKVAINEGYLVPRHLLTGLLAHFHEEWPKLIRAYSRTASAHHSVLNAFRAYQAHLFSCWLLWGPSIAVCTCPRWEGPIAMQYGYGDEGNSIAVVSPNNSHLKAYEQFRALADRQLAMPAKVSGRIRLGSTLRQRSICAAQQDLRANSGSVLLDADEVALVAGKVDTSTMPYYSAYVWVLFVLCTEKDGKWLPYYEEAPVRCLFPFFEHGNVADSATYAEYKRMVATTAICSLQTVLRTINADRDPRLGFMYGCAVDDSACGKRLRFQDDCGPTIRALAQELVLQRELASHIIFPDQPAIWQSQHFSSCHLPENYERYYREVAVPTENEGGDLPETGTRTDAAAPQPIEINLDNLPLLERAYHALYEREFPDPNERESLENMKDYLFKKDNGTWGAGDYHIGVIEIEGEPAAMSVCDYFAEPCTGAIEFLVVDSRHRGRALGKLLLGWTERRLKSDARRHSKRELRAIVAEMNDPFMRSEVRDNLDPFERCLIWHRWGYRLLDMPYSQPALSRRQKPVRNLVLIAKVFANGDCADTAGPQAEAKVEAIDAELVRATVMEYLKLAMRIEHPEQCREYVETATFLGSRDREQRGVPGISLGRYIGRCLDDGSELSIAEVTLGDPDFDGVMALYDEYFPEGETRIQHHEFLAFIAATFRQDNETTRARRWRIFGRLAEGRHRAALLAKSQFHYHLWAIRFAGNTSVDGVASFFTLRAAGFGGYVAFRKSGEARPGRLRALIARIEEQIIRDSSIAVGWFIEVEPERSRLIEHFKQHGFFMVDAEYVQPTIAMDTEAPVQTKRLRLMYKPLGRVYTKPTLDREVAESWHAELLEIVYGLSRHSRAFKVLDSAWCAQLRSKAPARLLE